MNIKRCAILILISLLALSSAGCSVCGWPVLGRSPRPVSTPGPELVVLTPTPLPPEVVREADAEERLLINIYKRVNPAVVHILVIKRIDSQGLTVPGIPGLPDMQRPEEFYQQGAGSGFVIDKEGNIVTNNHVVEDAEELQVTFHDGTIVRAEIIGRDPDSDLAVIRVDVSASKLYPVELGDSDALEIGQRAMAVGNPFGLDGTLTTGIISGLGRSLPLGRASAVIGGRFSIPEIIQTDTAINPGNSGGPLLDSEGHVIGVNMAYDASAAGIGFAVPVNTVKRVVPRLIEDGRYAYPWLGITGTDLSLDVVEAMDLPVDRGAIVIAITPDSPADDAGLRGSNESVKITGGEITIGGDVIVAIDEQRVNQFEDILVYILRYAKVGQKVELRIIRDGRERLVEVKLGERPD